MNVKEMLEKREQLNYELIEATTSKQITSLTTELFSIESEIELATGKSIEEVDAEVASV